MELFKASRQWAERPADERFSSVQELHEVCAGYRAQARTAVTPYRALTVLPEGQEVMIQGEKGRSAALTHWAFGQLSQRAEAPASYMRTLPAEFAATCLNHGLAKRDGEAHLMFHQNGGLIARSITSERYDRIWNSDITQRLLALTEQGWRLPPARPALQGQPGSRPATAADVLPPEMGIGGLSIAVGDLIAPAGAYASDHDMFVFLIDPTRPVKDPCGQLLWRGFFSWNSEVGAASFGLETFLFRAVCGNHIVWSASDVKQVRIRHVGDANGRAEEMFAQVYRYRESSASDDEAKLQAAGSYRLGSNKDEVLDALFKLRLPVSQVTIRTALDLAEENYQSDGDPYSAYGVANGLTRMSQRTAYADERVSIDRAAGKVMEIAF